MTRRSRRGHEAGRAGRGMLLPVLAVLLGAAVLLLPGSVTGPSTGGPVLMNDYMEYWSAGRLNLSGRDPYSVELLSETQSAAGWPAANRTAQMWNPPWTLPLVEPFSLLPYRSASFAWILFAVAALAAAGGLLWVHYGGDPSRSTRGALVAFLFAPGLMVVLAGQIAPLILIGVTGFLVCEARARHAAAGALLFLGAIKPHLLLPVACVALAWAIRDRKWTFLAGGLGAAAILSALAAASNPAVFEQYRALVASAQPRDYVTPTIGATLRFLFGFERFGLQLLPGLLGAAWAVWHWLRRRGDWQWSAELPLLLLVSVLTAAYTWIYDYVVLLPAVAQGAVWWSAAPQGRGRKGIAAGFLLLSGAIFLQHLLVPSAYVHIWVAPVLLAGYVWVRRWAGGKSGGS